MSTGTTAAASAGTAPGAEDRAAASAPADGGLRERLDELDRRIIDLVRERCRVSAAAGEASRTAARRAGADGEAVGGLAREMQIFDRYRTALGRHGTELARALLHLCRGRL